MGFYGFLWIIMGLSSFFMDNNNLYKHNTSCDSLMCINYIFKSMEIFLLGNLTRKQFFVILLT